MDSPEAIASMDTMYGTSYQVSTIKMPFTIPILCSSTNDHENMGIIEQRR